MKIRMMNQIITDPKMQDRECNFALKAVKKQSRWDMIFELLNKINNRLDRLESDVRQLKSDVSNIYSILDKNNIR